MKRMQIIASLAAAIALLASTSVVEAQPFLYASTQGEGKLVKIDVGAGTVTEIGPFGVPAADAIAISPQGKLYTVTQGWPPDRANLTPQLASVDLATGQAAPFGVNLYSEIFMGIGFSPNGKLYGVNAASGSKNQNSLYQFDLKTGKAKKVGVTGGCGYIMDLAWYQGKMYGAAFDSLYCINLETGEAELVTKLQGLTQVMGLAIDDDGNFYVSEILPDAPLWRVDPVTGAATAVAGVSLSYPHGLEFIPADADGDQNHGDAKNTFTKWITKLFPPSGIFADMAGVVGGDVGDGTFTGEAITRVEGDDGVVRIEAAYHFHGSKHSFTAAVHVEQTGNDGVITGVVTDGWLKGHAVEGKYTQSDCDKGPVFLCFHGTLDIIKSHSNDQRLTSGSR